MSARKACHEAEPELIATEEDMLFTNQYLSLTEKKAVFFLLAQTNSKLCWLRCILQENLDEHAYAETWIETSRTLIAQMMKREHVQTGFSAHLPDVFQLLERRIALIDGQLRRNIEAAIEENDSLHPYPPLADAS